MAAHSVVPVLVALGGHSALGAQALHYTHTHALPAGTLVRVPLGTRSTLGIVWDAHGPSAVPEGTQLRALQEVFDALPPLDAHWRAMVGFVARYYQRNLSEVALSALPPALRDLTAAQLQKKLRALHKACEPDGGPPEQPPQLAAQQSAALDAFFAPAAPQGSAPRPALLFGVTGSGKTEVYLRAVQRVLSQDEHGQVLIMVPEINLTPQLTQRFAQRFAQQRIVCLHSGVTPVQRLNAWLAAHTAAARIVLGTRMAVLASLPHLRLIVADEEHDASYKQQEGARYSARDMAVWRAQHCKARVLLASATPSVESWRHSRAAGSESPQDGGGRYLRLHMPQRVGAARLPGVRLLDMTAQPRATVLAPELLQALRARAACGEQSLVLLNRRGYAPVLHCPHCAWKSQCPHCSAYCVFHKSDRCLRCHHCGYSQSVPRACPACGNPDIRSLGQGTQRLEEHLLQELANAQGPQGRPVAIARIDADTSRRSGALAQQLARMHSAEIDILVGTQMIAKGHDFRRVTLVAALNVDAALFSSDFRGPERLFALLMQAAGRAGRDAALGGSPAQLWVQTHFPSHPLFGALQNHDYPAFAARQLQERANAQMPPYSYQALMRAEARSQQAAQDFLNALRAAATRMTAAEHVSCYPAVPMTPQRIANRERAQMLIESTQRPALQALLGALSEQLHAPAKQPRDILRWAIDVDPLAV